MPRKKKTIVEEVIPDDAPVNDQEDFASVVCVVTKVYKLNSGGKSFCYQTSEPVDEVTLQAQYPTGGKFVVIEYNTLNQPINQTHIDIEPKPSTSVTNGNGDIRLQMLMDELNYSRSMMLRMIEGLFSSKGQQPATPLGELAQAMQAIHEISGKSNPVDLIVKGMELGAKANGGAADWKAELVSAAKEVLPTAIQTIGAARQIQPQQVQPMIQTTPVAMIKQGIEWLKPQILGGMSVDLAIGWVIQQSNSGNQLCQQLLAHAIQGDVNTFIQIDAEIANEPYRTWFTTAIQQLKDEWHAAQSANDSDNDGGNGDDTDITDDAKVSSGKSKIVKVS